MKIANKRELQQTACNHSSDIDFIYKTCTAKPYSFLVIGATHLRFRINPVGRI